MQSFLQKVGLVKKEEQEPESAAKSRPRIATTSTPGGIPGGITSIPVTPLTTGHPAVSPDDMIKYGAYIDDAVAKADLPGPDYSEFSKALSALAGQPLDERTKFISVFAGFAAQGVTTDKLLSSSEQYIKIITDAKVSFDAEVDAAKDGVIGGMQRDIENLGKENLSLVKQIEEINTKIASNNTKITQLSHDVQDKSSQIGMKSASFDAVYSDRVASIKSNQDKIRSYLAGWGQDVKSNT